MTEKKEGKMTTESNGQEKGETLDREKVFEHYQACALEVITVEFYVFYLS